MSTTPTEQAARALHAAQRICVSTGAGMSAESGVETFRGEDGLWSKVRIEEIATPEAFQRDPEKVWAWYR
jgi:NAD-dependent deacetylase